MGNICSGDRATEPVVPDTSENGGKQEAVAGAHATAKNAEPRASVNAIKMSKEIDRMMKHGQEQDKRVHRVVLLGAGECGKTTMVQHMAIVHGKKHTAQELAVLGGLIRATLVEYMTMLVHAVCDSLAGESLEDESMTQEEFERRVDIVKGGGDPYTPEQLKEKAEAFAPIWKLKKSHEAFELRDRYHLPEHSDYFFDKVEEVMSDEYVPSIPDMLRIRVQSTGISEINLDVDGQTITLVDVGGQRSERKKWLHCFTDVAAVLFVSSLAEFDQMCFEDDTTPRWMESKSIFENICISPHLSESSFILFLNKHDLFMEKIKTRNFGDFVHDYDGDGSPEDCIRFLTDMYKKINQDGCDQLGYNRELYVHCTTAIDEENVRKVLHDVRHTVLSSSLSKDGLLD